jgi:anti-sigma regulatory factor (Ser/Thr protein kinase)
VYSGPQDFLDGVTTFVQAGIAAGEPTLVMVRREQIRTLQAGLGPVPGVEYADIGRIGANPARIIPAWADFVARRGGRGALRGVGEPLWVGRSPAEVVECQRHEALLNVAFAAASFRLLCPYDAALPAPWLAESECSHPHVAAGATGSPRSSAAFRPGVPERAPFDAPWEEPPGECVERVIVGAPALVDVRAVASACAGAAGWSDLGVAELSLCLQELATNTLRHGGGVGRLRVWRDGSDLVCEMRDAGTIRDPLVGRRRPARRQDGGRGLWIVNQMADLFRVRSSAAGGTTVRVHLSAR